MVPMKRTDLLVHLPKVPPTLSISIWGALVNNEAAVMPLPLMVNVVVVPSVKPLLKSKSLFNFDLQAKKTLLS